MSEQLSLPQDEVLSTSYKDLVTDEGRYNDAVLREIGQKSSQESPLTIVVHPFSVLRVPRNQEDTQRYNSYMDSLMGVISGVSERSAPIVILQPYPYEIYASERPSRFSHRDRTSTVLVNTAKREFTRDCLLQNIPISECYIAVTHPASPTPAVDMISYGRNYDYLTRIFCQKLADQGISDVVIAGCYYNPSLCGPSGGCVAFLSEKFEELGVTVSITATYPMSTPG